MLSRCFVVLLIALGLVLVGGPAFADPPDQTRTTGSAEPVELPEGAPCPFPVLIEVELNIKAISFAEPVGQGIATLTVGNITAVVTNMRTGASVSLDISGPAFLDQSGGLVFGTGQTLFPTDDELVHSAGRLTLDPAGGFELSGRTRDVCAMLAEA